MIVSKRSAVSRMETARCRINYQYCRGFCVRTADVDRLRVSWSPGAGTLHHGDNVIVIASTHLAGTILLGGWVDAQVEADGITPVARRTWGDLKLFYR